MNGQTDLPKESSELIRKIKGSGISVGEVSINPICKNNYENRFISVKGGDYLNINYGGHNHKISVSPNGHNFKAYQKKIKKILNSF